MGVYRLPDRHSKYLARQRQFRSGLFFGAAGHDRPDEADGPDNSCYLLTIPAISFKSSA